ncbi:unnamed protein product [Urochloa decumbens]|uniref:Phytocyanin domain-containing protein n=1 Tax=Urochloa decumbens TaxID=240449 RepID=A0ABC9A3D2_9POAL
MAKPSSYGLALACFAVAVAVTGATQFTVGGANGWSVPAAAAEPFNTWAERTRFQIGDSLVFVYPKDQDSVLLVNPAEYNACNTSSYVKRFDDGDTVVTLDHAGALFFISGVEAHCRANEKLIVMVLASARNNGTGGAPAPATTTPAAPPPPPPASTSTSPPPASSDIPPPPPATKAPTAASPPPAGSVSAPPPASASAPPTATPSAPPPAASSPPAPGASSPAPAASKPPPSVPAGVPEAPPATSASSPAPGARGTANSTGTPPSRQAGGSKHKNGAAVAVASGIASSVGACVLGYAILAL